MECMSGYSKQSIHDEIVTCLLRCSSFCVRRPEQISPPPGFGCSRPQRTTWRQENSSAMFLEPLSADGHTSGGSVMRSIIEAIKGLIYLLAFITGGSYVRQA